jgi:phage recombination protein Bet
MSNVISMSRAAVRPLEFTADQLRMIQDSYAMGATDEEFAVLMEIAKVRRLNPLLKQIHFVKRWSSDLNREVWSCQTSIDGMRAIAERTGLYDGQDETEFRYAKDPSRVRRVLEAAAVSGDPTKILEAFDKITDPNALTGSVLLMAKTRVYRKDWSQGRCAVGLAHWNEYVQLRKDGTPTKFWNEKPHVMLAKCSEAIALRKAFPEDLSGLYAEEEITESSVEPETSQRGSETSGRMHSVESTPVRPVEPKALGNRLAAKLAARGDVRKANVVIEEEGEISAEDKTRAEPTEEEMAGAFMAP